MSFAKPYVHLSDLFDLL